MSVIENNKNIRHLNTFGIDTSTEYFAEIHNVDNLLHLVKNEVFSEKPQLVLGGGSNILFTKPFRGLVIHNLLKGKNVIQKNQDYVIVEFASGEVWHECVMHCVENGWSGVENLSLIPGSIGAAPIQNIGAYGVELKDSFHSLKAFHFSTGQIHHFSSEDCQFGYRDSVFKNRLKDQYFILSVALKLERISKVNTSYGAIETVLNNRNIKSPTIRDVSDAVIHIRQSKLPDPAVIGNGGSFFKNPVISTDLFEKIRTEYPDVPSYPAGDLVKVPAGWLIDRDGWKGFRRGDVGVHKDQALVLVNFGNGTGLQIKELATEIQESVFKRFKIKLQPEVNIL